MHLPFSQGGIHVTVKKNKAQQGAIFIEKYKYRQAKLLLSAGSINSEYI